MRIFMGNRRQYTCTVYIISAVYMHRIRHQYVRDARRRVLLVFFAS